MISFIVYNFSSSIHLILSLSHQGLFLHTETASLKVINKIHVTKSISSQSSSYLTSALFDTVDHTLLFDLLFSLNSRMPFTADFLLTSLDSPVTFPWLVPFHFTDLLILVFQICPWISSLLCLNLLL